MTGKELQWAVIVAVVYVGIGYALWYYNRANNPRFPAAYPSPLSGPDYWALTWTVKQWQS